MREIGLNERQSSAWSEAKACLSHVVGNLFFNMPRAAINKNDGFGGGTVIEHNMITNTCRESGDHGNFVSARDPSLSLAGLSDEVSLRTELVGPSALPHRGWQRLALHHPGLPRDSRELPHQQL